MMTLQNQMRERAKALTEAAQTNADGMARSGYSDEQAKRAFVEVFRSLARELENAARNLDSYECSPKLSFVETQSA